MARRRKKQDLLSELTSIVPLFAGIVSYLTSQSFTVAIVVFLGLFIFLLSLIFIRRLYREERLKQSGIHDIDMMDGRQFELYLGLLFKSQGYKVDVTRSTGDYGADLIIEKNNRRIVVQAKRYSKNVGIKAVQEAQAAVAYYKAHEAWVVSNQSYTDAATSLAASNGVRLIDREKLIEMAIKMNPSMKTTPKQIIQNLPQETRKCTRCGNDMVIRKGSSGEFWGCKSFPKCRATIKMNK